MGSCACVIPYPLDMNDVSEMKNNGKRPSTCCIYHVDCYITSFHLKTATA